MAVVRVFDMDTLLPPSADGGRSPSRDVLLGHEVQLNAIPSECSLLNAIARNEIDAQLLTFVPFYFRLRRSNRHKADDLTRGDADRKLFGELLEDMVATHPGIDHRYCDLDRRFDWLKWLLSQCAKDNDEEQIVQDSIFGELRIFPAANSVQGFPIRFTSPERTRSIDLWLSNLSLEDLKNKFHPDKMNAAGLYKWSDSADLDADFVWLVEDFKALQKFYNAVSWHSESVLVVVD